MTPRTQDTIANTAENWYEGQSQATQEATQTFFDERRDGPSTSGLVDGDVADVICILHPASRPAYHVATHTAIHNRQLYLKSFNAGLVGNGTQLSPETLEADDESFPAPTRKPSGDIVLRFSADVKSPACGFCFGRKPDLCDVVLDESNSHKRISNVHFRIFLNPSGVLMLEDLSTNGSMVDQVPVGGKREAIVNGQKTKVMRAHPWRVLDSGSVIEVCVEPDLEYIKFVVRLPSREAAEEDWIDNFHSYMENQQAADTRRLMALRGPRGVGGDGAIAPAPVIPAYYTALADPPCLRSDYGMAWSGGHKYKCTGVLGKGAFATVYLIATRLNGELFAAKELEKRRFMRNGVLDKKLDSELQIMQRIHHPNVVQFFDTQETEKHLYIMMEYVPYGDLTHYLKEPEHLTLTEDLGRTMTMQILSALSHLHEEGITHRDIKPDNILIASEEPFIVKLTDFGLSKSVNNEETFLRTFCGTLLYCAPEVFPFYDTGAVKQKKRQRGSVPRSYSELVDLWSYAAVLWHVLCGEPPFEGIMDSTGRAMFNNIMDSKLNPTALLRHGISQTCIDLLAKLLTIDPAQRPSISQCFEHAWLVGTPIVPGSRHDTTLASIDEEDEEPDCSQLSLVDRNTPSRGKASSSDLGSQPQTKRQKADHTRQVRNAPPLPSSPAPSPFRATLDGAYDDTSPRPKKVNPAVLKSSGVFGIPPPPQVDENMYDDETLVHSDTRPAEESETSSSGEIVDWPVPPTVGGAEKLVRDESVGELVTSMVRDMNMASSPDSAIGSVSYTMVSHPETDVTLTSKGQSRDGLPESQNKTPKSQQQFRRQIELPVSASFFYDPYDPQTHTVEYASKISGIDFAAQSLDHNKENNKKTNSSFLATFIKPQPVLGKLISTADSFASVSLHISSRVTTWGRMPTCTNVYPNGHDTRIPKLALELMFHAPGIDKVERDGGDWTKLDDLELLVRTGSSKGILVNGVVLPDRDNKGRKCFGRLYTGDEVCVSRSAPGGSRTQGESLKFKCEFHVGKSKKERRSRSSKFFVETQENE